MSVSSTVMESMKNSSSIMAKVNEDMNIGEIQGMIRTF